MIKILITFAISLILSKAEDQGDWVDTNNLPIDFPVHPFFAGYIELSEDQQFYYVYYPSQKNPNKDPLVVRISGGPGCSSLYSFIYSKGPFIFTPNTSNFRHNKHNWNKQANVLFLEGPGGVGYSKGQSDGLSDIEFAVLNFGAMLKFYEKFPELKDQDVYFTGDQYAGVTVPTLSKLITEWNKNPYTPVWQKIRLKGFLLENPCTLPDECDSHFQFSHYQMKYLERHYFISRQKYQQYSASCSLMTPQCQKIRVEIEDHFMKTGSDIRNPYKQCFKQTGPQYYKCIDLIGATEFFNNPDVQKDMHVDEPKHWELCNFTIMENYVRNSQGSFKIYEQLLKEEHNLRIWIVSGSLSAIVPIVGTRKWIEDLKVNLGVPILRPWESWKYDEDINAGQIQQIQGLTFITVRSAGAHLYNDQPEIGYHIIDSFLKGIPL